MKSRPWRPTDIAFGARIGGHTGPKARDVAARERTTVDAAVAGLFGKPDQGDFGEVFQARRLVSADQDGVRTVFGQEILDRVHAHDVELCPLFRRREISRAADEPSLVVLARHGDLRILIHRDTAVGAIDPDRVREGAAVRVQRRRRA